MSAGADLGLAGRRVLVTGAAQGIGRATALRLASLGARPILANLKDCAEAAAACGEGAAAHPLDLADAAGTAALVRRLAAEEPLWGVVNCAGVLLRPSSRDGHERLGRADAVDRVQVAS